jgi:hypothetical protein
MAVTPDGGRAGHEGASDIVPPCFRCQVWSIEAADQQARIVEAVRKPCFTFGLERSLRPRTKCGRPCRPRDAVPEVAGLLPERREPNTSAVKNAENLR